MILWVYPICGNPGLVRFVEVVGSGRQGRVNWRCRKHCRTGRVSVRLEAALSPIPVPFGLVEDTFRVEMTKVARSAR